MPIVKIPLPRQLLIKDSTQTSEGLGARLIDCGIDELGHIKKRPGLPLMKDLETNAKVDGLFWWDKRDVLIAVSGGNIFKITDQSGTNTNITGDALNSGRPVSFTDLNDSSAVNTLFMANGNKIMSYQNTGVTANLTDATAPVNVTKIDNMNSFLLALQENSAIVHHADAFDPFSWSGNAIQAINKSDDVQSFGVANSAIFMVGKQTIEFWVPAGDLPFDVLESATLQFGTIAPNSLVNAAGAWIWASDNNQIMMYNRGTVRVISDLISDQIRGLGSITDARSMYINFGIRKWYVMTLPTAKRTFVYDLGLDKWAEWGDWNQATGVYDVFKGLSYAYAKSWNKHIVGDNKTGKLYFLDSNIFQDDGDDIRNLVRTGHISHGTLAEKSSNNVIMRFKRGAGGLSGDEPLLKFRYRDDNSTFSNWITISMGKIGQSIFIAKLTRMGIYRTRQYEISFLGDADFIMIDMQEEYELTGR